MKLLPTQWGIQPESGHVVRAEDVARDEERLDVANRVFDARVAGDPRIGGTASEIDELDVEGDDVRRRDLVRRDRNATRGQVADAEIDEWIRDLAIAIRSSLRRWGDAAR